MKNILFIFLSIITINMNSQNEIHKKLNEVLNNTYPALKLENKIIVVQFQGEQQQEQTKLLQELEKTAKIYEHAKLKGGLKGVICVVVVKNTTEEIALNKTNNTKIKIIKRENLMLNTQENLDNITYNSDGDVVYKNTETNKLYESISKLITR